MISGTPVQNQLYEFFAVLDFCMPGCLGASAHFNKTYGRPIERARDRDGDSTPQQPSTLSSFEHSGTRAYSLPPLLS